MKNKSHASKLRRPDLNLHRIRETPESNLESKHQEFKHDLSLCLS